MPKSFVIKSFSQPGVSYNMRQYSNGEWSCNCLAFLYRGHKTGACDHIRRARHMRMKSHGTKLLTKKRRLANIKKYNRYCKRYVAKQDKLMKLNLGRIVTITRLYTELEKLRKDIIKVKRLI